MIGMIKQTYFLRINQFGNSQKQKTPYSPLAEPEYRVFWVLPEHQLFFTQALRSGEQLLNDPKVRDAYLGG